MTTTPAVPVWVVDEARTTSNGLYLVHPIDGHEVYVKWDGCTHYSEYGEWEMDGTPTKTEETTQYLHICGSEHLDALIERLVQLRAFAREHFKWNEGSAATDAWEARAPVEVKP